MVSREVQLELELLRAHARVRDLEEVVTQQSEALKECSKLLQRCRPHTRPAIPHERKVIQAALQNFKCADPYGSCPLWKISDGTFCVSGGLWETDHNLPWSSCYYSAGNLQSLCSLCHSVKSRRDRLAAMEAEEQAKVEGAEEEATDK